MPDPVPASVANGVVLGFDFGLRRIGVALGNGLTRSARPLQILRRTSDRLNDAAWHEIASLITQWTPDMLVVGVARHPDGQDHAMTAHCERFARQLEGRFRLAVARVDERYSTAVLPGDHASDDAAAAVILQQWFDETSDLAKVTAC
jgi:putative Holliday junction resolvase